MVMNRYSVDQPSADEQRLIQGGRWPASSSSKAPKRRAPAHCAEHAGQQCSSARAASTDVTHRRHGERLWQCSSCRPQTSLISDTLFASTKLPLTRWFLALHSLIPGKTNMAALKLMRRGGICYRTACRVNCKIIQGMTERQAGTPAQQLRAPGRSCRRSGWLSSPARITPGGWC